SCIPLLLIQSLGAAEVVKGIAVTREPYAFLGAQPQEPSVGEGVAEQTDDTILQTTVKIDEDVTAGNELHFAENGIGDQAVVGEYHTFAQALVEDGRAVVGGVVVGQRGFAARLSMVLGEGRNLLQVVDTRLRARQRFRID